MDEVNSSSSVNLIDYNNDGLTDVFILNDFRKSSLFKNLGENTFVKVEGNALVDLEIQGRSATWGDIDNDNLPDVIITTSSYNYLFHNNGDDTFTHIESGNLGSENGDSNGAAWGDVNNDGFIDCYISNVIANGQMYINDQDNTFSPLASGDVLNRDEGGIDASFIDVNADMSTDLFVSVYFGTNSLYLNERGDLILDEDSNLSLSYESPSVGASWADYDNDGDFDVLVTNNVNTSDEFYENDGLGKFSRVYNLVTNSNIRGSGSSWLDFDNDGWEDVIIVSEDSKVLFRNLGNKEFEVIDEYALSDTQYSTSVATGDLNNDGFEDIVVTNDTRNEYFLNNTNENNWIKVKAKGTINNKSAIGAKVKVITPELEMTKPIMTNSGNDGQSPFIKQFGLAQSTEAEIQVYWPNNGIQIIAGANVNETHELVEVALPQAPTELKELNLAYNQLELSWVDNSSDELGFIVYRKSEAGPRFVRLDTVGANTTSYIDLNVGPVSTYSYYVSAYIVEGTSFETNTLELTTPVAPPLAPGNLEISKTSDGNLQLTWQDNSDNEDSITVERSVGDDTGFEELVTLNANTQNFEDSEVQIGQTYFYRVFASNTSGDSDYSNVVSDSPITSVISEIDNEVNIFPNPASSKLFVEGNLDDYSYRIIELSGKIVQAGKITSEKYINVSKLTIGSYILEIYKGDVKIQHRLLIHN